MRVDATLLAAILIAAAVFTAVQAAWGLVSVARAKRTMNDRLKAADRIGSLADLVVELRKQRGLTSSGEQRDGWRWLTDLITRSGLVYNPRKWVLTVVCVSAGLATLGLVLSQNFLIAVLGAILGATVLPVGFLKFKAARRAKLLAEQLPNALQIMVRSLEAGHPVPTSIALVGREMPDPIGSEFGMAADEIAFGASLAQAVERIAQRCRHEDVDLFASVIRLQERSGGNLVGLLKMIAKTIRERLKMRLKIKALSSEGKASAMILIAAPFGTAGILHVMAPDFYGEVIGEPVVPIVLACLGFWMFLGAMVMRKMINLKI